ncbi:hypothetical protein ILYODFUR_025584 [Ilyodon furcidens]|uniref:Secreted protein n=1 Tax=Ilyodon furcidens TaxID=33524 RepID=A0ABV0UVF9_9TELE
MGFINCNSHRTGLSFFVSMCVSLFVCQRAQGGSLNKAESLRKAKALFSSSAALQTVFTSVSSLLFGLFKQIYWSVNVAVGRCAFLSRFVHVCKTHTTHYLLPRAPRMGEQTTRVRHDKWT